MVAPDAAGVDDAAAEGVPVLAGDGDSAGFAPAGAAGDADGLGVLSWQPAQTPARRTRTTEQRRILSDDIELDSLGPYWGTPERGIGSDQRLRVKATGEHTRP
jgi:hypothetical protein